MKITFFKTEFFQTISIVLLFTLFFASACKKEAPNKQGKIPGVTSVSFKFDGLQQNYTNIKALNDGNSYIQVKASQTTDTTTNELEFHFFVDSSIEDGVTYHYGDVVYSLKYYDAAGIMYSITSGEITFSDETTSHIKGTFSGLVKNGNTTKVISEGAFEVNL